MGRTAFIFPGQGAQYAGMGKDFYEQIPLCRQVMDMAGEIAELDLKKLCFEENEQLHITEFTQIAMIAVEAAILKALEAEGIRPQVAAGLSLGEYGAVLAAGVLSMEDTFSVVRKRGIYMQEAVPEGGAMSAVLGLSGEQVEQICEKEPGMVSVANYNCPGQVVITGEARAVENASEKLKDAGARRVLPLKVSGPFHSPMLKKAEERLRGDIKRNFHTKAMDSLCSQCDRRICDRSRGSQGASGAPGVLSREMAAVRANHACRPGRYFYRSGTG